MRTETFDLPNGFMMNNELVKDIEFRKLDGNDQDFVLDKENLKKGQILDRLIKRACVRLGNMTDKTVIETAYDQHFLLADMTFCLISLRRWGIGPIYKFEAMCERCETIAPYRTDLRDLEVTPQKDEDRGKEEFVETISVPDSEPCVITFRPLYAKDNSLLKTVKETYGKEKGTRELLIQLKKLNDKKADPQAVKSLDWAVLNSIREKMDSHMGGMNIELIMECKKCSNRPFKDTMPIEARSFFFQGEVSSEMTQARPYHKYGAISSSSEESSDGSQAKSAASA